MSIVNTDNTIREKVVNTGLDMMESSQEGWSLKGLDSWHWKEMFQGERTKV